MQQVEGYLVHPYTTPLKEDSWVQHNPQNKIIGHFHDKSFRNHINLVETGILINMQVILLYAHLIKKAT